MENTVRYVRYTYLLRNEQDTQPQMCVRTRTCTAHTRTHTRTQKHKGEQTFEGDESLAATIE